MKKRFVLCLVLTMVLSILFSRGASIILKNYSYLSIIKACGGSIIGLIIGIIFVKHNLIKD